MHVCDVTLFISLLLAPAEVVVLTSNSTVDIGSTTLLTCVGYGVPTPTITWEKSGDSLMNDTRVCTRIYYKYTEHVFQQDMLKYI